MDLESAAAQAGADMRNASARATQASINYTNFGPAEYDRQQSAARHRSLTEETKHLDVTSPINGTVVTPRLHDLLGTYLKPGSNVAEVADLSAMTARIYVPEFSMQMSAWDPPSGFMARHSSPDGLELWAHSRRHHPRLKVVWWKKPSWKEFGRQSSTSETWSCKIGGT